jgi:hypothetical protein
VREVEEEIVDTGPGHPLCILYKLESPLHTGDRFYTTFDGRDASFIYESKISMERPEQEIVAHRG